MNKLECDIAIIGGGLGGVAAALAAVDGGATVILSEQHAWLGGQMTSQGVSALDEHEQIEKFGGTRTYNELRQRIRNYYHEQYGARVNMPNGAPLNPGNGWVSKLCFEPRAALYALEAMLASRLSTGRLTILHGYHPSTATVQGKQIESVTLEKRDAQSPGDEDRATLEVSAQHFIDATELGDLLPLSNTAYVIGAESFAETNETLASNLAKPEEVQSFTFCFAVEYCPGEDHTMPKPANYEIWREKQPYTLSIPKHGDPIQLRHFRMFEAGEVGLPFWSYRRIVDSQLLDHSDQPHDIALINWPGNDYYWGNIVDKTPAEQQQFLQEAKELALGFLYWLQTEAPRDEGGLGYPELKLRPDIMGTLDGLSQAPYIRESRRILARRRIVEQDIRAKNNPFARGRSFSDSCGIGWYHLDLHAAVGNPKSLFEPTKPYQIPLGALIPQETENLLAACKNIGTTHVTNGAYRLHPVEWNIGEAAGTLAAFCITNSLTPTEIHSTKPLLRKFQAALLNRGVPLAWAIDIDMNDPLFVPSQLLLLAGAIVPSSPLAQRLHIGLDLPLTEADRVSLLLAAQELIPGNVSALLMDSGSWRQFCTAFAPMLQAASTIY